MNPHFYLISSILLVTVSQLFFKKGVTKVSEHQAEGIRAKITFALFQKDIMIGLFLNGVAAVLWLLTLSKLELSYVFPFLSLNYILIPVAAYFLYKEEISNYRKAGIAIICIGIFIIAFS